LFIKSWGKYCKARERKNKTDTFIEAAECRRLLQKIAGEGHTPKKELEIMHSYLGGVLTKQNVQKLYQELYDQSRRFSQ
jgi:hypothetical protein